MLLVYVVLIGAMFYFLIFRPQKKRKKEEEEMKNSIVLGVDVVTIGGICGKIINIKDDTITIQSSIDNTLIEFKSWAIREIQKPVSDEENTKATK
ncbi:MAG: preprotein translocase subunit YajC [Clostridia bacterium]|nr:preprotein translocase subunit YajC [Clostridia bacterium]